MLHVHVLTYYLENYIVNLCQNIGLKKIICNISGVKGKLGKFTNIKRYSISEKCEGYEREGGLI